MTVLHAAFGWLVLFVKLGLTLGGFLAAVAGMFVGLSSGTWTLGVIGVAAVLLGQVVHVVDERVLDLQFKGWAIEALGSGPTPPRQVRLQLMKSVTAEVGYRGDLKLEFQAACREWAAEDELAVYGADL